MKIKLFIGGLIAGLLLSLLFCDGTKKMSAASGGKYQIATSCGMLDGITEIYETVLDTETGAVISRTRVRAFSISISQ